jgi:hypothetical protein
MFHMFLFVVQIRCSTLMHVNIYRPLERALIISTSSTYSEYTASLRWHDQCTIVYSSGKSKIHIRPPQCAVQDEVRLYSSLHSLSKGKISLAANLVVYTYTVTCMHAKRWLSVCRYRPRDKVNVSIKGRLRCATSSCLHLVSADCMAVVVQWRT